MKTRANKAFTMVEILIAIGLMGILCVLLLSAFSGISQRMDQATCANNLRQLYLLTNAYVADNGGRYPPDLSGSVNNVTLYWRRSLLPYMALKAGGSGATADVFRSKLTCPPIRREIEARGGSPDIASFGFNVYISDPAEPLLRGIPQVSVRAPSRTFLATEACLKAGATQPLEVIRPEYMTTCPTVWNPHNGYQNLLYLDGHIEFFKDIRLLGKAPYSPGSENDIWTP